MNLNLDKSITRSQQLHIDRKMIGILSVFAILGVCLVVTIIIATSTLSGLRGFGSMQTHWTEARKESTFQLVRYIETQEPRYLAGYNASMSPIRSATLAQQELLKEETDNQVVREHLLELHTMPDDVSIMIKTFERFHEFRDFAESVRLWKESDQVIYEMADMASEIQTLIDSDLFTPEEQEIQIEQAVRLDRQLTELQYDLAASLGAGTRFLQTVIVWMSSSLGLLLLIIGGLLSFRFLKSVKNWQLSIEVSEQRFRSLFEQNPNAVYSFTKDGRFASGNKALQKMTGYPIEELKGKTFEHLVDPSEIDDVLEHFEEAVNGTPQTYEATGVNKKGEKIFTEVTNLPIYVNGEIVGVFGIAQDITDRKEAEQVIRKQLEEKTHLLSEVHDRVKNNLALISGLIQLEREYNDPTDEDYLDSTVSRIHSMAMVHDRLYHSDTFSSIRMDEYVRELCESVKNSSDFNSESYKLQIKTDPVILSVKKAIPMGLLLNELLVNTFNYAFKNRDSGEVKVEFVQQGKEVILTVADNGVGLPEDFTLKNPKTMGMKLITILSKQLNASLEFESGTDTKFTVRFPTNRGIFKSA